MKTKTNKKKILKIISFSLIGIIIIGVLFFNSLLNSGKPLKNPVSITRDENGVAHINAESIEDAYFAQGYTHAQDRMFNIDLSRRTGAGTLSEVFGDMAVEQDQYYLTLGLKRAAEKSLKEYDPETIELLESYTSGINAYILEKKEDKKWATEFKLLNYEPELWLTVDSLLLGKLMAHDMAGHWESQVFRQYLLDNYTEEEALELFPDLPSNAPTHIVSGNLAEDMLSVNIPFKNEHNGSNNWVISGAKTESGKPLVANDPHLSIATPSIWYINHLITPEIEISGATFAGVPGIILGQNNYGAWGVTNTGPDVQDVYVEKINPDNDKQYLFKDEWLDMDVFEYTMKVKGSEDIVYEVRETIHGPIISDLAKGIEQENNMAYSLRWTALEPTFELQALVDANVAKNWTEFEKALENFQAPAMNFVYADLEGNIAYKPNGRIPIRDNNGTGLLPVEGWTGKNEWLGYIPFDELPKSVNPKEGYIATANYKIVGDDYPYHLSNNWAQPYRQMRIVEVLENNNSLTTEDMRILQGDTKNLEAVEFLDLIVDRLNNSDNIKGKEAAEVLLKWKEDGYLDDIDKAGALVFNSMMDEIPKILFEEIPEEVRKNMKGTGNTTDSLLRKYSDGENSIWIEKVGGLDVLLSKALDNTIEKIKPEQGDKIANWEYGKYHQVMFSHPLSSQAILKPFFNSKGRIPSSGSKVTVRAAGYNDKGLNNHGASWRFVADLNDLSKTEQIVAPGMSGHNKSPYYHDQIENWINGNLYTVDILNFSGEVLNLIPK